ncbi:MAG: HD domain-containing protein [Firmicutes bacterium]|nr:HD domain-containing protein [Bacillota bacterium]
MKPGPASGVFEMNQKEILSTNINLSESLRNKRFRRLLIMLMVLAVLITVFNLWMSVRLYTENTRVMRLKTAEGLANVASEVVPADRINDFIHLGENAEGYSETKAILQSIRDNNPEIEYLYVYQIRQDGCYVVFDTDSEDLPGEEPGSLVGFDESFMEYLPTLLAGEEIDPIESDDSYGWLLTAYKSIKDADGVTRAYAGADVSMNDVREYIRYYEVRMGVASGVFLILILATGLFFANDYKRMSELELMREKQNRNKLLLREIVEDFAKIVDMKDKYTNGHSARVAKYTRMLATEMGYDEETIEKYYYIALMHDVGKIGVPEEVLNKPGKLTDEEFGIIKSHTTLGENVLKDISIMPELSKGAEYHHERPDGKGYPKGLKGDEIPEFARIIAVADTFDAMYSNRPYRSRMNFDKVVSIIQEVSGTQLDPDVVDAFMRLVEKGKFKDPNDDGGGSMEDINNIRKSYEKASIEA